MKNLDPATMREVDKIIEDLKNRRISFPKKCCTEAAIELYNRLGLNIEAGFLRGEEHTWNSLGEDYVDITSGQYEGLPQVLVLSKEDATHLYGYVPSSGVRETVHSYMDFSEIESSVEEMSRALPV